MKTSSGRGSPLLWNMLQHHKRFPHHSDRRIIIFEVNLVIEEALETLTECHHQTSSCFFTICIGYFSCREKCVRIDVIECERKGQNGLSFVFVTRQTEAAQSHGICVVEGGR